LEKTVLESLLIREIADFFCHPSCPRDVSSLLRGVVSEFLYACCSRTDPGSKDHTSSVLEVREEAGLEAVNIYALTGDHHCNFW
jgi:outer membrane biogenesis lipoprotein LolB